MMFRRRFIAILTGVALCMTSQLARADDRSADDAISAALAYLSNQQIADGSFEPHGQKLATTGLGLLAFVSTGNTSDGGRYAATVRRATEFLLRQTPGDRYFGAVDGSRMYGHAIVTLALCDAYGVEPDETIRARIRATVKDATAILIAAQNVKKSAEQAGGWGDDRGSTESDPIISQWCLTELRAADQIGVTVPKETLDRATAYLARHPFADKPHPATEPSPSSSDALYFASRSGFLRDESSWKSASRILIDSQLSDGSWPADVPSESLTRVRATSLAVATLSLPMDLLP